MEGQKDRQTKKADLFALTQMDGRQSERNLSRNMAFIKLPIEAGLTPSSYELKEILS